MDTLTSQASNVFFVILSDQFGGKISQITEISQGYPDRLIWRDANTLYFIKLSSVFYLKIYGVKNSKFPS